MKQLATAIFSTLLCVTAAAQDLPSATSPQPVAIVNGSVISAAILEAAVQLAAANGAKDSPDLRRAIKSELIARELLRQEAEKKQLAADPEVQLAISQARNAAMITKLLREAVKPEVVSEAAVRAQYDKVVASLGATEYKVRIMQLSNDAQAKSVLTQLRAGQSFAELAQLHSSAASAKVGGALNWISFKQPFKDGETQGVPLPVAEAITKLKPGMVSAESIVWKSNAYLVKVEEARPTQVPTYEQVRASIARMLQQTQLERASAAYVASLMKNAKIEH